MLLLGPDQFVGLPILLANIGLSQIYHWRDVYVRSPICTDIKILFFKAVKNYVLM